MIANPRPICYHVSVIKKEVIYMTDMILKAMESATQHVSIGQIIRIIIILLVVIAAYIALVIVQKRLKAKLNLSGDVRRVHTYTTAFRIGKILVILIGAFTILQALGVNLSGFAVGLGAIVVLVALSLKDSLQDVFVGITLLTDKYFAVGDAVEYDGKEGIVISFTVRTTKIELLSDRSVLSVANRNITKIRKLTHLVDIDLPLPYELERKEAYAVLLGICDQIRKLEGIESCELKGTQDFADSAIMYKIRFFCEPNNRPDIRRAVIKTIQDGLAEAGIQIPYQQLDIHKK